MHKILIVDDEKLLRQGFIHMTKWPEHGFYIAGEAANGKEALSLIETIEPEIVITDIRMPVMDGIELTRKIKEIFPQIQVIVLSSYDDFDYVRETLKLGALDYFLKPKMELPELLHLLEKAKQKLKEIRQPGYLIEYGNGSRRESFLRDLLVGKLDDETLIKRCLDQMEVPLNAENIVLMIMVLSQNSDIYQNVAGTIQNGLTPFFNTYTFFFNGSYVTLTNCPPSQLGRLKNLGGQLVDRIAQKHQLTVKMIISDCCERFSAIAAAYRQTAQKIPYLFYRESREIILPGEAFNAATLNYDLGPLQSFIEKQNLEGLKEYIKAQISTSIQAARYPEPYDLKKWLIEICFLVIQSLTKLGCNTVSINKNKFTLFKKIEGSSSLMDLLKTFEGIIGDFQSLAADSQYGRYNPIIKRIIDYLLGHYPENISLASMAVLFHVNKSYLCQLFKQETGENFNDYLTKIRIEKAKELLLNSENNINTVGNSVGFSNPSYFAQVFKSLAKITPSEYIRLHKTPLDNPQTEH